MAGFATVMAIVKVVAHYCPNQVMMYTVCQNQAKRKAVSSFYLPFSVIFLIIILNYVHTVTFLSIACTL